MQIDIAQRTFENNKALVEKGFISNTALETSWATLEGLKATHQSALAGVEVAKKALDDTKVIAPISGVVSVRSTQPGERVGIDARIVEIVDLNRLELEATLAAGDSIGIRIGQTALLAIEGTTKSVKARVARINPAATAGSRSVLVYLALENAGGLRQGMFAQGTLDTAVINTLAVPKAAVRTDKPAPYLQVIENKKIAHKTVVLGSSGEFDGNQYVAVQGIAENTIVLQGNVGAVREGVAVKGQ
jgi:RND family efflux transporter MFP subunit